MAGGSAPQISTEAVLVLLDQLTAYNPTNIQQAEAQLTKLLTNPAVLSPLLHILCSHPAPQSRHLSAILLRRTLKVHFLQLSPQERTQFKDHLITRIPVEPDPASRRGLIALCAAICRVEKELWPQLIQAAGTLSSSPEAPLRVTAFTIFSSICDVVPHAVVPHLPDLTTLLASGLRDSDLNVRIAALHAYNSATTPAATNEGDHLAALSALLPSVVAVATAFPDRETDECARLVCAVFEVLTRITDIAAGKHIKPYFNDACQFALQLFASDANPAARSAANEFLVYAAESKPKTMRKAGIALAAVQTACKLVFENAEAAAGPPDEDDDDYESDHVPLSLRLLDALAKRPELAKIVFAEVITSVNRSFDSAASAPNRYYLYAAGYRLIGAIAEGTSIELTGHAQEIISRLAAGATDEAAIYEARARALGALGLVCEALDTDEMPDEITAEVANAALSAVVSGMRHEKLFVKKHACMSLEAAITMFKDTEALRRRVGDVMHALGDLGVEAAVEAVMAVGVLAEYATDAFAESHIYKDVIEGTVRLMSDTTSDVLTRAAAVETAGVLISACRDQAVIEKLASHAIRGLDDDEPTTKHATFSFFARMCDAIGGSVVAVFGQRILEAAIESMKREDIMFVPDEDEDDVGQVGGTDANGDDDEFGKGSFQVRTAYLDEKAVATACVGAFSSAYASDAYVNSVASSAEAASAIRDLFASAITHIEDMATYFHEDVRSAAYRAHARLCGANLSVMAKNPSLAFADENLLSNTFNRFVYCLTEDDDVWVVTNVLNACSVFLSEIPAEIVAKFKSSIIEALEVLIRGEATCQTCDDDEPIEAGDEVIDGDDVGGLIEAVGDVIEALARSQRGYFATDFAPLLLKMLNTLYSNSSSARHRGMVLGAVSGVLLFLNWERCTSFTPPKKGTAEHELALQTSDDTGALVLPLALEAVRSTESKTLQRNAVFLMGIIFAKTRASKTEVWQLLPQALSIFDKIISSGKSGNGALVDNAAGAVARILTAKGAPSSVIGNGRTMMYAVLNCVPLDDDPTENTTIARAILQMGKSDFGALVEASLVQNVASCLATAVLVYGEAMKKERKLKWIGNDEDPNDEMASLDEVEVKELVRLVTQVRESVGDAVFMKLGLRPEDERSFGELVKMYNN